MSPASTCKQQRSRWGFRLKRRSRTSEREQPPVAEHFLQRDRAIKFIFTRTALVRSFRSSPDETRRIAIDLEFTSDGTERKDFDGPGRQDSGVADKEAEPVLAQGIGHFAGPCLDERAQSSALNFTLS
jgi:hypothetical protein